LIELSCVEFMEVRARELAEHDVVLAVAAISAAVEKPLAPELDVVAAHYPQAGPEKRA